MSRLFAAVIGSTALLAAAPAVAGPCEQLAGGRWLFYLEGGSPTVVETGFMDFRDGIPNGVIFRARGSTTFPPGVMPMPIAHGTSVWNRSSGCVAQPGNVARMNISLNNMDLSVSVDGRTAMLAGDFGGGRRLTGWATREPARSFTQRPRN